MKLNSKLFAQMRAATKSLIGGDGSKSATAIIQDALKVLTPNKTAASATPQPAPAMRDINPPPPTARSSAAGTKAREAEPQAPGSAQAAPEPAPKTPVQEATEAFQNMVPDLMANLEKAGLKAGLTGNGGFKMPHFDLPAFDKSAIDLSSLDNLMGGAAGGAGPAEVWPGQFIDGSFTNAAGTRSYKLYVPSSYTGTAVPLVVMLHGCTQDPVDFAKGTQMNALAEEMNCLVVYPAQSLQANSSRCWNWFSAVDQQRGQGEPSIIAGITETVMHSHAVDRDQVYVAGLSAGGAMAAIMGAQYPELYAAVGVHSGLPFASAHDLPSALAAMKGNFGKPPAKCGTIPIIVFHGDKDTTVHPVNGDEVMRQRERASANEIVIEPGRVPDGHAYTRTVHQDDNGAPEAEQWLIHGAGHAWSGGSARGSYTDGKGPDASREMMRFFQTKR